MTCWTAFLSVVLPPLAVADKGCGTTLVVFFLWLAGGVPGMIAALVINGMNPPPRRRFVRVPKLSGAEEDLATDSAWEERRTKAYIHLADGEVAEVVEDDGALPLDDFEKPKR